MSAIDKLSTLNTRRKPMTTEDITKRKEPSTLFPPGADRTVLAPIGGQRCCHEGCGSPARFWIGPADSNGLDDYTEMCAEHQPEYTGVNDIVAEFDDRGYPSGPAAEVTP